MSHLFSPLNIGSLTLPNRIVIAPMCQYSANEGTPSDWHIIHLGHLALSGAGLLTIEATAVSPEARITPWDLGLYNEANEAGLAHVLKAVRAWSPVPLAIQLAHAGRKASTKAPWDGGGQIKPDQPLGWKTVGPSALPHQEHDDPPQALDAVGLRKVRDDFAAATRRAARLGIDAIEVHMAHGYLLHQFLSPLANQREDAYGGSLENRMRFPLEVFEVVRQTFPPDRPVWARLSATDWVPGGWDLNGTVALSEALKHRGCSAIHVSSGGLSADQAIKTGPSYQVPFAQRVKHEVGLPTIAVGLITQAQQAESILVTGQADAVALARGVLYDPRWPWHAAAELGAKVFAPKQYWRSQPHQYKTLFDMDSAA